MNNQKSFFSATTGDKLHTKGRFVWDFDRTWVVTRVTKAQVEAVFVNAEFAVHEKTAFGRMAKGETEAGQLLLSEVNSEQSGKLVAKFWRHGRNAGFRVGDSDTLATVL